MGFTLWFETHIHKHTYPLNEKEILRVIVSSNFLHFDGFIVLQRPISTLILKWDADIIHSYCIVILNMYNYISIYYNKFHFHVDVFVGGLFLFSSVICRCLTIVFIILKTFQICKKGCTYTHYIYIFQAGNNYINYYMF